jgi:hypothetical protein
MVRFGLLVDLGEVRLPVLNAKVHKSAVNKVERLAVRPFLVDIINLEANIRWHTMNHQSCPRLAANLNHTSSAGSARGQRQ